MENKIIGKDIDGKKDTKKLAKKKFYQKMKAEKQ